MKDINLIIHTSDGEEVVNTEWIDNNLDLGVSQKVSLKRGVSLTIDLSQ